MSKTPKKSIPTPKLFGLAPSADVPVSVWQLISQPFKKLFNNGQLFFMTAIPTAVLLTLCSVLFKRSALCSLMPDLAITSPLCSDEAPLFYADMAIRFVLLLFFSIKWYRFAFKKEPLTFKNIFSVTASQAKAFGLLTLNILINFMPIIALLIMAYRVPNPNWKIELVFFTSVAWIFLLPILAIRFYALIGFAADDKKCPPLREVWHNTAGNMLKLLLSAAVLIFLALVVFMQYYASVGSIDKITLLTASTVECEYDILLTFFMVLFMNYSRTQQELLFKGANNEK